VPLSVGVQFVPILTSFARRSGMFPAGVGWDRMPPSRSRLRRLTPALLLQALGLRPPRPLRSRMASFISELASHEVPGFGAPALPSVLGLEALASASAIARDHGVSASGRRWRSCLRRLGNQLGIKCRDAAISTRTKAPEGLESCRRGGASSCGVIGEGWSGSLCDFGRCFPNRLRLMLYTAPPDL
jgi:hypothetical protein